GTGRRSGLKIRRRKPCRFDSGPGHHRAGMRLAAAGAMISEDKSPVQDEDLARWARELGVSYEELASTLTYAGPTVKALTFRREAAVMADARLAGEDDRAVMPDVQPVADLALCGDADAGDDLHQLLRNDGQRTGEGRAPRRGAPHSVDRARPESLRQKEGA